MIVKFTLDKMDPICMAVGRSSALKDVLENYTDIGYFCQDKIRSGERYGLGKLSYVTESSDALHLFDKKVAHHRLAKLKCRFRFNKCCKDQSAIRSFRCTFRTNSKAHVCQKAKSRTHPVNQSSSSLI